MSKDAVVHWLETREAESAPCGASSRDLMYSSSPTKEHVTCARCLAKRPKALKGHGGT